jgi:hypothetical protein
MAKKSVRSNREQRNLRIQQAIAVVIGLFVIFSMVISLIAK